MVTSPPRRLAIKHFITAILSKSSHFRASRTLSGELTVICTSISDFLTSAEHDFTFHWHHNRNLCRLCVITRNDYNFYLLLPKMFKVSLNIIIFNHIYHCQSLSTRYLWDPAGKKIEKTDKIRFPGGNEAKGRGGGARGIREKCD